MVKGHGKVGFRLDSRLPLTLPIFYKLIQVLLWGQTLQNMQLCLAMCSLPYDAFLRVGEMTVVLSSKSDVPLLDKLTKLVDTINEVSALKLSFLHYKHSYNRPTFSFQFLVERIFIRLI